MTGKRRRYNPASIDDTIRVARLCAADAGAPRYVSGTHGGFAIGHAAPPFKQTHVVVRADGSVETVKHEPWKS